MAVRPIYLDNQATTPLDPRVLDVMMPYLTSKFGNPHSAGHAYGWEGEAGVDIGRAQIAKLINADTPEEVYFMSGATEANNLAIKGTMQMIGAQRPHMVTLVTEHKCVTETMKACERAGFDLTILPVQSNGLVDMNLLADSITTKTAIVSVMAVNNEIGVAHDLRAIGEMCRTKGALLHSDAAQGFGKIPIDVQLMHIDLLSISGHKIYGPKGVGALYVRDGVKLVQQIHGGSQEKGMRSGTLSPALSAGLGKAAQIALAEMDDERVHAKILSDRLITGLRCLYPSVIINGDLDQRWIGNLNVSFPDLNGEILLANLRGVAVSSGSACSSGSGMGSYVLNALGLKKPLIKSAIRMGIGRFTTEEEIDKALDIFKAALQKMGKLSDKD